MTSIGRYQVREGVSPLSSKGPPKKSLNSLSIAVCRLASSPVGLQRLNAIFPTPPVLDELGGSLRRSHTTLHAGFKPGRLKPWRAGDMTWGRGARGHPHASKRRL